MAPQHSRLAIRTFHAILFVVTLLFLWLFRPYLDVIVLALVFVVLFQPFNKWLTQKLRGRRSLSAGITTAIIVFAIIIPFSALIMSLATQAHALYMRTRDTPSLSEIIDFFTGDSPLSIHIRELLEPFGIDWHPSSIAKMAADLFTQFALFLSEKLAGIAGFAGNLMTFAIDFCVMLTLIYAFLAYSDELRAFIKKLSPFPAHEENVLIDRFKQISRTVFFGNGVASVVQGVLVGLGFFFFDLGSAVLWGTVSALLAFLPIVGASIVFLPAAGLLLLKGQVGMAVLYVGYNLVVSLIVEYWLKSKLIGNGGEMNPILAFFAVMTGISVFGILGLFYGPLIVAMFLTFVAIYQEYYWPSIALRLNRGAVPTATGEAPKDAAPSADAAKSADAPPAKS